MVVILAILFVLGLAGYLIWRRRYGYPPREFPVILAYHKVDNRFEFGITRTTVAQFHRQMQYLSQNGFKVIRPDQLFAADSIANPVLLTFDDGYEEFYRTAFPILQGYDFPALIFLITDYVGKLNLWDANLGWIRFRHLDWNQIREMSESGIVFGSHTRTHRDLTRLSGVEIYRELAESKAVIEEKLGKRVDYLSYPFGNYDARVIEIAKELGYTAAFSLYPRHSNQIIEPFALQRTSTYLHDIRFSYAIKVRQCYSRLYWAQDMLGRTINWFSYGTIAYTDLKERLRNKA
ncbi:MAG TPA: hypothetical protein DHW42_01385 [Candidatus Marinimicrobia bacterium]|nr:hypothetical protein [Candidatus Neomarinimicrobiota bacterium]